MGWFFTKAALLIFGSVDAFHAQAQLTEKTRYSSSGAD